MHSTLLMTMGRFGGGPPAAVCGGGGTVVVRSGAAVRCDVDGR